MTALLRSQLGPELEIVVLEMSLEEQMERIRGRHEGSENAVDMMKVGSTHFCADYQLSHFVAGFL